MQLRVTNILPVNCSGECRINFVRKVREDIVIATLVVSLGRARGQHRDITITAKHGRGVISGGFVPVNILTTLPESRPSNPVGHV